MTTSNPQSTWYSKYPAVRTISPLIMTRTELLQILQSGKAAEDGTLLVDLRRNDHDGGTIRGSMNLPAQSLYYSIPKLYGILSKAQIKQVVWYCGSSRGRGNRAAGWFADYCEDQGNTELKSKVLFEGIAGWALAGPEYVALMDEYDEAEWKEKAATK